MPALVAFMVLAGVSVSLAGRPDPTPAPEPTASVTIAQPGRWGHRGDEGPGGSDEASLSEEWSADAAAACAAALEAGDVALEEQHGLQRAIEVVLANCEKNPAAQGLLNALEHLSAHQERQNASEQGGRPNENASEQGGRPNENASERASGNAGTPPGQSEGAQKPRGNDRAAEHTNEDASSSTHP